MPANCTQLGILGAKTYQFLILLHFFQEHSISWHYLDLTCNHRSLLQSLVISPVQYTVMSEGPWGSWPESSLLYFIPGCFIWHRMNQDKITSLLPSHMSTTWIELISSYEREMTPQFAVLKRVKLWWHCYRHISVHPQPMSFIWHRIFIMCFHFRTSLFNEDYIPYPSFFIRNTQNQWKAGENILLRILLNFLSNEIRLTRKFNHLSLLLLISLLYWT